jgi:hypothetical protein
MRTTTRIWFGLGASAVALGAGGAREPASWMPELARSAHAQASAECPEGSTTAECVQGGEAGEGGERGAGDEAGGEGGEADGEGGEADGEGGEADGEGGEGGTGG